MSDFIELKRLAMEATPGPWEIQVSHYPESGDMIVTTDPNGWELLEMREDCPAHEANAAFIAAANPKAIMALIAENERLTKQLHMMVRQCLPLEAMEGMPGWSEVVEAHKAIEQRDQARAEVDALRKDAERYRFLRSHGVLLKNHDFLSYGEIADFRIDAMSSGSIIPPDPVSELLKSLDRAHAGHMVGHDQSDQPKGGYSEGYVRGYGACIESARRILGIKP